MNHRSFTDGLWQCEPRDKSIREVQDGRSVKRSYGAASSLVKETADDWTNRAARVENAD